MRILLAILLILTTFSCGKFRFLKKSSQENQDVSKIYASGNLILRVYYEPDAEPYTDFAGLSGFKVWSVVEKNLKAMFPGKTITVPMNLVEMAPITAKNETVWTVAEIQALGSSLGSTSSADTTVFNIFFLKGQAENANVVGLHLSGTQTLVIFKDVVERPGNTDLVKRYIEQATVVHEVGHAVGLVNNGIPMTTPHEDPSHRAHCSNPDCVMYWQNEGAADLAQFLQTRINNPDVVLLDRACLNDVTSYK